MFLLRTAHGAGLPVLEGASQGCLLELPLLLLGQRSPLLVPGLLQRLGVHCELDGIGRRSSAEVVHPSLETLCA